MTPPKHNKVHIGWVSTLGLVAAAVLSNLAGRSLNPRLVVLLTEQEEHSVFHLSPATHGNEIGVKAGTYALDLPWPVLHKGKTPPKAFYTGEYFDDPEETGSTNLTTWSRQRVDIHLDLSGGSGESRSAQEASQDDEEDEEEDEEDPHDDSPFQPAGQHLLMDLAHVDPSFLMDVERLAQAMVSVITQSRLTLLSYHCHDLQAPMGVSCVGILVESHVSIHTWPAAGVICLDLFTCGSQSLLPLVPVLGDLFGIPPAGDHDIRPVMNWSHKKRGYQDYFDDNGNLLDLGSAAAAQNKDSIDSERYLLGLPGHLRKAVGVRETTIHQQVEVFEMAPEAERSKVDSSSPHSVNNNNKSRSNKKVFLDGVLQSTLHGLEAYHEALVHPALVSHPDPKRVAIIGGGEGATLREVLKHNTVETCVMVEIDAEFVSLARRHLPEWNDCGSHHSCFDDARTELHTEDAISWFIDRFGDSENVEEEDKFDVIVMDVLDPSVAVEFSDILYTDKTFLTSLTNALTSSGILVAQIGEANSFTEGNDHGASSPDRVAVQHMLSTFRRTIQDNGAVRMKSYAESHGQFHSPWDFNVAFMSSTSERRFNMDPAQIDLVLAQRTTVQSSSSNKGDNPSPFRYFDGATMKNYQFPSRIVENVFCSTPVPAGHEEPSELCQAPRGFDPSLQNVPSSSLEMRASTIPNAGRGIFFTQSFPTGSYYAIDDGVHSMQVMPGTYELVHDFLEIDDDKAVKGHWMLFPNYFDGYGFYSDFYGGDSCFIDPGLSTFVNHGCNGTNSVGVRLDVTEFTADPDEMPDELNDASPTEFFFYNPTAERNYLTQATSGDRLQVDVHAGQEVLDNYLDHLTEDGWAEEVQALKRQCLGQEVGIVTGYEQENFHNHSRRRNEGTKLDLGFRDQYLYC